MTIKNLLACNGCESVWEGTSAPNWMVLRYMSKDTYNDHGQDYHFCSRACVVKWKTV
jgi:hypothetical protein